MLCSNLVRYEMYSLFSLNKFITIFYISSSNQNPWFVKWILKTPSWMLTHPHWRHALKNIFCLTSKRISWDITIHFILTLGVKESCITMKSSPKVTKANPKITKKRPIYEAKLFSGRNWGSPLNDPLKYLFRQT